MAAEDLVSKIRDHYVEQFQAFVDAQTASCTRGAAEVKLQLTGENELFQHMYCADFMRNDDEPGMVELHAPSVLAFDPFTATVGDVAVAFEQLRWDDVLVHHDAEDLPTDVVAAWFRVWFDPEDERYAAEAPLGLVIHSLLVQAHLVSVDFGTAEVGAFSTLIQMLIAAGASTIRVTASRVEATASN